MAPAEDGLSITYSCGKDGQAQPPDLRFLHYNDVYHVEYELLSLFVHAPLDSHFVLTNG